MSTLDLKKVACPSCGGSIDSKLVAEALGADLKLMKCPFCDGTIYLEEEESSNKKGYEFEKGRIKAQKEQEEKERKLKEEEERKRFEELQQIENERLKRLAEENAEIAKLNEIKRRKQEKISWIVALVTHFVLVFVAFFFVHEFASAVTGGIATPWIFKGGLQYSIIHSLGGILLFVFIPGGLIIGIIHAIRYRGEKHMFAVLWLWFWCILWIPILYSIKNGVSVFAAIPEVIKKIH